eukprot:353858-Chlamydomonas_euryale.AAC.4
MNNNIPTNTSPLTASPVHMKEDYPSDANYLVTYEAIHMSLFVLYELDLVSLWLNSCCLLKSWWDWVAWLADHAPSGGIGLERHATGSHVQVGGAGLGWGGSRPCAMACHL